MHNKLEVPVNNSVSMQLVPGYKSSTSIPAVSGRSGF